MKPALKTFLALAIGGSLLSIVSFVVWVMVNSADIGGIAFGHVVSVGSGTVVIADRHEGAVTVHVGTGTIVTDKQRDIAPENIPVGQFVQVRGVRREKNVIDARIIRFMRSPRGDEPPHEAPQ